MSKINIDNSWSDILSVVNEHSTVVNCCTRAPYQQLVLKWPIHLLTGLRFSFTLSMFLLLYWPTDWLEKRLRNGLFSVEWDRNLNSGSESQHILDLLIPFDWPQLPCSVYAISPCLLQTSPVSLTPASVTPHPLFSQIESMEAVVIVWRVGGKIIRSDVCRIVCNNCAQCSAHTHTHIMKRPNSCLLVRLSISLIILCVTVYLCSI